MLTTGNLDQCVYKAQEDRVEWPATDMVFGERKMTPLSDVARKVLRVLAETKRRASKKDRKRSNKSGQLVYPAPPHRPYRGWGGS